MGIICLVRWYFVLIGFVLTLYPTGQLQAIHTRAVSFGDVIARGEELSPHWLQGTVCDYVELKAQADAFTVALLKASSVNILVAKRMRLTILEMVRSLRCCACAPLVCVLCYELY